MASSDDSPPRQEEFALRSRKRRAQTLLRSLLPEEDGASTATLVMQHVEHG